MLGGNLFPFSRWTWTWTTPWTSRTWTFSAHSPRSTLPRRLPAVATRPGFEEVGSCGPCWTWRRRTRWRSSIAADLVNRSMGDSEPARILAAVAQKMQRPPLSSSTCHLAGTRTGRRTKTKMQPFSSQLHWRRTLAVPVPSRLPEALATNVERYSLFSHSTLLNSTKTLL